jgi:hypothetical protein
MGVIWGQWMPKPYRFLSIGLTLMGLLLNEWRIWYTFGFDQLRRCLGFSVNLRLGWIGTMMIYWILFRKQSMPLKKKVI